MPNFVIHNEEYESGYLEGVQENLAITSQAGFAGISVVSQLVKGDLEKETIFTGDVSFQSRDPAATTVRASERFGLDEHVGVKISYNTPKQIIPQSDLVRSNFSNEAYSNQLGRNVAQNEFKFILNMSLKALRSALLSVAAVSGTSAAFVKKDLNTILRPLKDNAGKVNGFLAARSLMFDIVDNAIDGNNYGESGVVYGASPGTMGLPIMATALDAMDNGTNQWLMALFAEAMTITTDSNAPSIVIRQNDDTDNHYQTWSLDGAYNLKLKGLSYTGASGNVTEALVTAGANWTQLGSDENLAGSITQFGA